MFNYLFYFFTPIDIQLCKQHSNIKNKQKPKGFSSFVHKSSIIEERLSESSWNRLMRKGKNRNYLDYAV